MAVRLFTALGLFVLSLLGLLSAPDSHTLCRGFLPKNSWYIPEQADPAKATGITHAQFNEILDRIRDEFTGEISRRGGIFKIERDWGNGEVNAYADRSGRNWIIRMFGGLARYSSMTYDGFMAVACHETGHQIGGAPKFSGGDWASVEGEADYYSSLKCLKRIFARDDNAKIMANRPVDPLALSACEHEHRSQQDIWLCVRATMAGNDLADVLAKLDQSPLPKLNTPDLRRVTETFEEHPRAQCRLDTYFHGALCTAIAASPIGDNDYRAGTCTDLRSQPEGVRPRCWFAPTPAM